MPWSVELDQDDRIVARFEGLLDEAGGVESAAKVAELLAVPRELVLDVPNMTGYKRAARLAWQHALWTRRSSIRRFVLLGGNSVVRMGAGMMAMFLGRPLVVEAGAPRASSERAESDAPRRIRRRASSRALASARHATGPLATGRPL
ncbi:hypothetical protein ACNOYE_39785 [Nannocystaceae bacterium ST9]